MPASGRGQFNFSIDPTLKEAFLEKARFDGTSGTALLLLWIKPTLMARRSLSPKNLLRKTKCAEESLCCGDGE